MNGKTVLVVDDDVDFGFFMKDFFSKRGYQVFLANSISMGMGILDREKPGVMLLDNNLPDGLGWSKTEFILTNYPDIKLILVSALEVPQTSSSSFSILYKPLIKDGLQKMFD